MSKRFFSKTGSKEKVVYEPYFDDAGARKLKIVGIENIDEYIQSFRESTDINVILQRFAAGDRSVLNVRPSFYGDFTQAPKTLADFLNAQNAAFKMFDELPLNVRESFDNDANKFFVTYGTPQWFDTVNKFVKEISLDEQKR